ncbi:MAG: DinB family protein [Vicinamibacterales bacterium]
MHETVATEFTKYFEDFAGRARRLVEPLSDEQFWTRPYPYGNSAGHLLLHITGNLNYYIGAQIAGTGYVRDRDREFTDPSRRPKAEVLAALDDAVATVTRTLRAQTAEDWSREYSAVGVPDRNRFGIVLRCAQHFHHHLGQIIYIVKEHTR